jgi:hypothetical protein
MSTAMTHHSPTERWCVFVLLCVYCFLSIAVFTPLHTHSAKGACSLGGFDHQFSEPAEAGDPVQPYTLLSWLASQPPCNTPGLHGSPHVDSRAPPRALFLSIL